VRAKSPAGQRNQPLLGWDLGARGGHWIGLGRSTRRRSRLAHSVRHNSFPARLNASATRTVPAGYWRCTSRPGWRRRQWSASPSPERPGSGGRRASSTAWTTATSVSLATS
jgi:hypothetical protein